MSLATCFCETIFPLYSSKNKYKNKLNIEDHICLQVAAIVPNAEQGKAITSEALNTNL